MVQMGGVLPTESPEEISKMSDFDRGLVCTSVIPAILLGIAIDYGHWWLGVPSGLATVLMAGVFARRHIFKRLHRHSP